MNLLGGERTMEIIGTSQAAAAMNMGVVPTAGISKNTKFTKFFLIFRIGPRYCEIHHENIIDTMTG